MEILSLKSSCETQAILTADQRRSLLDQLLTGPMCNHCRELERFDVVSNRCADGDVVVASNRFVDGRRVNTITVIMSTTTVRISIN